MAGARAAGASWAMRLLYQFPISPYSRRARLALMHKGLTVELRDAFGDPALFAEARRQGPLQTMPVFVEEDGGVIGDSMALTHYLDIAYPSAPALWPRNREDAHRIVEVTSLADAALTALIDVGIRYHALHTAEAWRDVAGEQARRAQRALDALGERLSSLSRPTVTASGWSAPDMWVFTAVTWMEVLPSIADTMPFAAQVLSIGYSVPAAVTRWVDAHRDREDVRALA